MAYVYLLPLQLLIKGIAMSIGFYDFNNLHNKSFRDEVKKRFSEIVDSNAFVEGEYNDKFEKEFAEICGAKHALLVGNGTDALEISLQVHGIGEGDLVAIPGISFYATAEAVYNVGAKPIFVDVYEDTGLIDTESFKRIIQKFDIKAVIPVHIYGLPARIDELEMLCTPKDIKIIEDGAQGMGGVLHSGPIGSSGHLTCFSFYPTKNLGAFGDAGAILTNDDKLKDEIVSVRNHGRSPQGHRLIGRNSRCDHLQAAVLHLKLENIQNYNNARREAASFYFQHLSKLNQNLSDKIRLVPIHFLKESSWHLFPIGVKDRETKYKLREFLMSKGIGNALFYEKSLPEELPLKNVPGEIERSIEFAGTTLCLPMHPFLKETDVEDVTASLQEFFL